jgi:hypothetical protein
MIDGVEKTIYDINMNAAIAKEMEATRTKRPRALNASVPTISSLTESTRAGPVGESQPKQS